MKRIALLFFLLIITKSFSQNDEKVILVRDADSNAPIEDVTVYILKTKQSLQSNAEGKVSFILNGSSNIQVSHSAYLTVTVRSSALLKTDNVIYLKPNVKNLDEIIITKQHPQKILKSLVENSIKKLTIPARLKTYSREFLKINNEYSYYNDGIMNFQIFGRSKNFKSNILVEQNRSFGVVNDEINSDAMGYNLNNIMENYYNFKYLKPLLLTTSKNDYDFVIKAYTANENYYKIEVTALLTSKEYRDDFTIIYDKNKKIIIEVSSVISPMLLVAVEQKANIGSRNIYKSMFKNIYRDDGSNYYLISSKEEIGFERIEKDGKHEFEVRNYLVTTNFSNQNYSYKQTDIFKDKTLYNKKNTILSNYWDVSGITATEEEANIIKIIEEKSKRED